MKTAKSMHVFGAAFALAIAVLSTGATAQKSKPIDVDKARVVEHWTPERRAAAIPRDLVIDPRGLGYLRLPGGMLQPYGHSVAAQEAPRGQTPSPFAKPGGGTGDTIRPDISSMDPAAGKVISATYTFKATVTDAGGLRSVRFKVQKSGSTFVNSFSASAAGNNIWSVTIQGFSDGDWNWWVEAKDNAGNLATSPTVAFKVGASTGGGSGGSDGVVVANAQWLRDGPVQTAAGRIYFYMPTNAKRTRWAGYVCSGTVATDNTTGRSIIVTAAHCVYDDANKAFAKDVMFIPNQAGTTGAGTDRNCSNDPLGCWVPSFGVVDVNWTTRTFPDNVKWDYAYYVVQDSSAHLAGLSTSLDILDEATRSLPISFSTPQADVGGSTMDYTYALGYSYSEDPKFMYCAEDLHSLDSANWWLGSCGLSGGSSGGPWVQPMDTSTGSGPIISVNSWGYTNQPGMAGPKLSGPTASCVFEAARNILFEDVRTTSGDAGLAVTCN